MTSERHIKERLQTWILPCQLSGWSCPFIRIWRREKKKQRNKREGIFVGKVCTKFLRGFAFIQENLGWRLRLNPAFLPNQLSVCNVVLSSHIQTNFILDFGQHTRLLYIGLEPRHNRTVCRTGAKTQQDCV
jgi:hypothetical protein